MTRTHTTAFIVVVLILLIVVLTALRRITPYLDNEEFFQEQYRINTDTLNDTTIVIFH